MLNGVEHRFCVRHLYANLKKKFGGGTVIRDLMMGAAKATHHREWHTKMQQLKEINELAFNWLAAIPTRSWCKHAMSFYPRCDVIINNLYESFNSTILVARDKPILTMFEWIRTYLINRFDVLNEKMSKWNGNVCPKPRKRLDGEMLYAGNWIPRWNVEGVFEVQHYMNTGDRFVVDLNRFECSCRFW